MTPFEKELDKQYAIYLGGAPDEDENEEWQDFKKAIKQAVSTHIIGKDEPEITGYGKDGRPNIAPNYVFVNKLNSLRSKQRKALGDKA